MGSGVTFMKFALTGVIAEGSSAFWCWKKANSKGTMYINSTQALGYEARLTHRASTLSN